MRNIWFFLLLFPQNERKLHQCWSISFAQFVHFLREVCLLFNFWMMKLTNMFFDIIVNFNIQKLKSKHTTLKKYTNWAKLIYFSLVLREQEEKTNKFFAPNLYRKLHCYIDDFSLLQRLRPQSHEKLNCFPCSESKKKCLRPLILTARSLF